MREWGLSVVPGLPGTVRLPVLLGFIWGWPGTEPAPYRAGRVSWGEILSIRRLPQHCAGPSMTLRFVLTPSGVSRFVVPAPGTAPGGALPPDLQSGPSL